MKKKKGLILVAAIAGAAAVICGIAGIRQYLAEQEAGGGYDKVREAVRTEEPEEKTEDPESPEIPIDFDALQKRNPDAYAWITVPGTPIDYPILQDPDDNSYYLTETAEKVLFILAVYDIL